MKKLRMDLEQLVVDSFDTVATAPRKGTVFGEQCTCYTACTCPGCPTCVNTDCGQNTCAQTCNTCDWSCGGSCWYTECPGTGAGDRTCNPSVGVVQECCPY